MFQYNISIQIFIVFQYNIPIQIFIVFQYNISIQIFIVFQYNISIQIFIVFQYNIPIQILNVFQYNISIQIFIVLFSESKTICRHDCENGGFCNRVGQCDCQPGYYGVHCENGMYIIPANLNFNTHTTKLDDSRFISPSNH